MWSPRCSTSMKVLFIVECDIHGVELHHAVPRWQTVSAAYFCNYVQHSRESVCSYWQWASSSFMAMRGVTQLMLWLICIDGDAETYSIFTRYESLWLWSLPQNEQEHPLRSYSLVYAIVSLFVWIPIYSVSQNLTDKIGGIAEWTQTNISRCGTYGLKVQNTTQYHKMC